MSHRFARFLNPEPPAATTQTLQTQSSVLAPRLDYWAGGLFLVLGVFVAAFTLTAGSWFPTVLASGAAAWLWYARYRRQRQEKAAKLTAQAAQNLCLASLRQSAAREGAVSVLAALLAPRGYRDLTELPDSPVECPLFLATRRDQRALVAFHLPADTTLAGPAQAADFIAAGERNAAAIGFFLTATDFSMAALERLAQPGNLMNVTAWNGRRLAAWCALSGSPWYPNSERIAATLAAPTAAPTGSPELTLPQALAGDRRIVLRRLFTGLVLLAWSYFLGNAFGLRTIYLVLAAVNLLLAGWLLLRTRRRQAGVQTILAGEEAEAVRRQ